MLHFPLLLQFFVRSPSLEFTTQTVRQTDRPTEMLEPNIEGGGRFFPRIDSVILAASKNKAPAARRTKLAPSHVIGSPLAHLCRRLTGPFESRKVKRREELNLRMCQRASHCFSIELASNIFANKQEDSEERLLIIILKANVQAKFARSRIGRSGAWRRKIISAVIVRLRSQLTPKLKQLAHIKISRPRHSRKNSSFEEELTCTTRTHSYSSKCYSLQRLVFFFFFFLFDLGLAVRLSPLSCPREAIRSGHDLKHRVGQEQSCCRRRRRNANIQGLFVRSPPVCSSVGSNKLRLEPREQPTHSEGKNVCFG